MAGTQFWGVARWGVHQSVAYTGTAGTIANSFATGAYKARIVCTTDAYVKIGASGATTATTNDVFLPGNLPEYVTIRPSEVVSAIQSAAAGTLHVTEVD